MLTLPARRLRAAAALALVPMLLAPGAASAISRKDPSVRRVGLLATRDGDDLRLEGAGARLDQLLLRSLDPRDPRTLMDGLRAFLASEHGVGLPDLRPAHTAPGAVPAGFASGAVEASSTEEEDEPEPAGTYAVGVPADDLDEDGLDDVIVYEVELPQEVVTLRALRGTDGSELWHRALEASDAAGYQIPDVTGDGVDDVLLWTLEILEERETLECPEDGSQGNYCREEFEGEHVWHVAVQSGADGRTLWAEAYPGELYVEVVWLDAREPPHSRRSFTLRGSNLWVLPDVSGDHDGDGLIDLVTDAIDIDTEWRETDTGVQGFAYRTLGDDRFRATTRAEVVSGHTGERLFARTSVPGPGISLLWPGGDLVADEDVDLLWETFWVEDAAYECYTAAWLSECTDDPESNRVAYELEVLDGDGFELAWRLREPDLYDAFLWPLEEDLTGDGRDDLMLFESRVEGSELRFSEVVASGGGGEVLWRRDSPGDDWEYPVLIAPLGGDPGLDVVFGSMDSEWTFSDLLGMGDDTLIVHLRFARMEGASGHLLSETTTRLLDHPVEGSWAFTYGYFGGIADANGDGSEDLFGGAIVVSETEGQELSASSAARVETGASGTPVHELRRDGAWELIVWDDLTGDTAVDAFEAGYPLEDGPIRLDAVELRSGTALWSRDLFGSYVYLFSGGDQDGTPGTEPVLSEIFEEGDRYRSAVASLAGATGSHRWERSYE